MAIHIVKPGDSLWSIANEYNVTIATIINVNGLDSSFIIIPGLALFIPEDTLKNRIYYIKPNDTLWELAQIYGTTVEVILQENPNLVPMNLQIGQKINIPSPYKNPLITLGFAFPVTSGTVFKTLEQHSYQLTYLAIVAYSFTNEGVVKLENDDTALLAKCKQEGVTPLLMIRNFQNDEFSAELAGEVLASKKYRGNFVKSILDVVNQKGYGGVSMDIEFIPPASRSDYVRLLIELKKALGDSFLHVNVHSKTEDNFSNRIVGGHDYQEIGKVADLVAIMTIDYGYPTGPPDPVSPLWWMAQVLRYALTNIPANKLQAALPFYGYDWLVPENETTALSARNAQNQAISVRSDIEYDRAAASPWYTYWQDNHQHIVWFEDIRSITAKYELIDSYNIAGITFWQIGLQFPQNWAYMDQSILVLEKG